MPIHVILEFESQEQAMAALGQVGANHIVEWFDDAVIDKTADTVDGEELAAEVAAALSA
jgi:hypothetical protein